MNSVQIYSNSDYSIRTMQDLDGEVWFVAKDVCDILELTNVTEALRALDDDEKNTLRISEGKRGNPTVNVINEPGLYALVFRSSKPEAKEFSRWVRHEVLPAIRKTGQYSASTMQVNADNQRITLDIERAKILQRMIDAPVMPLTAESKAIIQHEVFKILTGNECLTMLPAVMERYYSATELGKIFGVSSNKIGRVAKANGLKSEECEPSQYGQWRLNKSRHSVHLCNTFVYNSDALEWFKAHSYLLH